MGTHVIQNILDLIISVMMFIVTLHLNAESFKDYHKNGDKAIPYLLMNGAMLGMITYICLEQMINMIGG